MTSLKTINYRGGIVRFRIPSSWVEEYEPEGGGTFYEDAPDSGTLRINVMGFEQRASEASTIETAHAMLSKLYGSDNVEQLPGGVAVARSNERTVEGDEELLVYTWQVGLRVLPASFRLVVFTYTILSAQEHTPAMQQELQLIDKNSCRGRISRRSWRSGRLHSRTVRKRAGTLSGSTKVFSKQTLEARLRRVNHETV